MVEPTNKDIGIANQCRFKTDNPRNRLMLELKNITADEKYFRSVIPVQDKLLKKQAEKSELKSVHMISGGMQRHMQADQERPLKLSAKLFSGMLIFPPPTDI